MWTKIKDSWASANILLVLSKVTPLLILIWKFSPLVSSRQPTFQKINHTDESNTPLFIRFMRSAWELMIDKGDHQVNFICAIWICTYKMCVFTTLTSLFSSRFLEFVVKTSPVLIGWVFGFIGPPPVYLLISWNRTVVTRTRSGKW